MKDRKGKNNANWKGGDYFKCSNINCNNLIWRTPSMIKFEIGKYCSKNCYISSIKGKKGIIPNEKTRNKIK
jgi:hypothetical protein